MHGSDADPADFLKRYSFGLLASAISAAPTRRCESGSHRLIDDDIAVVGLHAFRPHATGTCMVSVPRPGRHLAALEAAYDAWQERGASIARSQFPALRNLVAYEGPDDPADGQEAGRVVAWLRFKQSVAGRRIADVTAAFKAAVMSRYQRLYGDPLPRELHGHGFEGTGFEIARYLALPNVGFDHSDGRIHGVALWLPRISDETTTERTRASARSIEALRTSGLDIRLAPWDGERAPLAATPGRWQQRSETWVTAVPAIHERFGKLNLGQVRRWCQHAGLPEPVAFHSARVPLVEGALDLHPSEVQRSTDHAKPYSHVAIRFADAVRGPVVIGGGRSRGFGLCIPADLSNGPTKTHRATKHRG